MVVFDIVRLMLATPQFPENTIHTFRVRSCTMAIWARIAACQQSQMERVMKAKETAKQFKYLHLKANFLSHPRPGSIILRVSLHMSQEKSRYWTFSRMRSEGSRFTWGSGGEAVFAKFCVCVRNRRQPSATACVRAVRLSTVASASGVVPKVCQVDCLSPQLYWCLQRRCLCE